MHRFRRLLSTVLLLSGALLMSPFGRGEQETPVEALGRGLKLQKQGHHREALAVLEPLLVKPGLESHERIKTLEAAVNCVRNLNEAHRADALREQVAAAFPRDWQVMGFVAQSLLDAEDFGFVVAGEFQRGHHRGGGEYASPVDRDRVRALQILNGCRDEAEKHGNRSETVDYWTTFGKALLLGRADGDEWLLQSLTDLAKLPDYEKMAGGPWGWRGRAQGGAAKGTPVDANGNPVFFRVAETWDTAANDGERWRYTLARREAAGNGYLTYARIEYANFIRGLLGVETLADYGWFFQRPADEEKPATSGTWELHTLKDDETIARLATGVRRLTLLPEHDFIRIYTETKQWHLLAEIYTNRRQYPRAAEYWRKAIEEKTFDLDSCRQYLAQITGNWGTFEPHDGDVAGDTGFAFKFRNGKQVTFTAHRIKQKELLDDVKAYLASDPAELRWEKMNIGNIGWQMVHEKEDKYRGEQVAEWKLDLEPRPDHFDRRVRVKTPFQDAGAYLVRAKMADGNESFIVLWVSDTVIVKKNLASDAGAQAGIYCFVADARTGKPVPGADLDFFGYWQKQVAKPTPKRWANIFTTRFALKADADGQGIPTPAQLKPKEDVPQFLITATTPEGRLAWLGFSGIWHGGHHDAQYNEEKIFTITDRPVYRPGQPVQFKVWKGMGQFDQKDESRFAGQRYTVKIHNPKGEEVYRENLTADRFGGVSATFALKSGTDLGTYQIIVDDRSAQPFRVEEYKKPEFEVTIAAPTEPVMLGEKVTATVKAKYYFGSPVANGRVKVKVNRTPHDARWFAPMPWDWLYGPGYWWFGYDYDWYPGWHRWGCLRPRGWWWPAPAQPPELVVEQEAEIGPDGTFKVEFDTAFAKEAHGDEDHRYEITAEVTDESRRTITGSGQVLVARAPFKVHAWTHRGYYQVGDVAQVSFAARTLDGKPVAGTGKARLLALSYDANRQPVEKVAQEWDLNPDAEGGATQKFTASAPGQYRMVWSVTDEKKHVIEGAVVFVVRGPGFDGRNFRFSQLELVPDKPDYRPGEQAKVQVNTDLADTTVLWFARPSNGVYLRPELIRMDGKSTVRALDLGKRDMPNQFVEAVTVQNGRIYTEVRELVVPPEQRVLNIAVTPDQAEYQPGAEAKLEFAVTDAEGKPFAGSLALTVYDQALEYISGGANVGDIKSFFWKWRRQHQPQTESSLARGSGPMTKLNVIAMTNLGLFGDLEDMLDADGDENERSTSTRLEKRMAAPARKAMARGGMANRELSLGMPMPASAPAGAMMNEVASFAVADAALPQESGGDPGAPSAAEPAVRSNFADTAYWNGAIETDAQGKASVSFKMPENLSGWKIRSWGMGPGTRVGEGSGNVVTRKNVMVRLQTPRFLVEKDEVTVSANVHNELKTDQDFTVTLEFPQGFLAPTGPAETNKEGWHVLSRPLRLKAGGEQRVDWVLKAAREGEATVRVKAITAVESDAMQVTLPVQVHGMLKLDSASLVARPDQDAAKTTFRVPAERRVEQSRIEVRYSPTLAGAMVDALPYLANYPYGCTEQTLNRFLPTVITRKAIQDMGVNLADVKAKRTNLNAQEMGDAAERAAQWKRYKEDGVFDAETVDAMADDGLSTLYSQQLSDGGWGWFGGWGEHSTPHLTAWVVRGLQTAKRSGLAVAPDVLDRGIAWLVRYQREQAAEIANEKKGKEWADDMDALVFLILADADRDDKEMRGYLLRDRLRLAPYGKAMLALGLDKLGHNAERDELVRNLRQLVQTNAENQTAWLNLGNGGYWWYWYGSEYEAQAFFLKLLCRTEPKGETASGLVKYLLNNRKHATYWNSTRDTALVVEAFADFLAASGENKPDLDIEVWLDGAKRKSVHVDAANLFSFDNVFTLTGANVKAGEHTLEIRRKGTGPVYANVYVENFTLEDRISKAGLEVKVNRAYYRLIEEKADTKAVGARGQVVDQKTAKYRRVPLAEGEALTSGELVEVELIIESANDYEYLLIEDPKAAGFEPVEVRSGYNGNAIGAYVEFRDDRVCYFARTLARGKHSVAHRLRAEIPGSFSALPSKISALYAPELRGNGDEAKIGIRDVKE